MYESDGVEYGSDGIEEAIAHNARVALHGAERIGRALSKARDSIRATHEREGHHGRDDGRPSELEQRYETARGKALERLSVVDDPAWRDRAGPKEMADLYTLGKTWSFDSPEAQRASQVVRSQALERYGRDVAASGTEQAGFAAPASGPDRGPVDHGTGQRRAEKANALRTSGFDPELADAHARTHTMNARPPREAVADQPTSARPRGSRRAPRIHESRSDLDR